LIDPEDGRATILRNAGSYLSINRALTSRKTWIFQILSHLSLFPLKPIHPYFANPTATGFIDQHLTSPVQCTLDYPE